MASSEIGNLIIEFGIQDEMKKSFGNILKNHSCEELDIDNKNISIDLNKIEYSITEIGYYKFQTPIIDRAKFQTGYFALVVTNKNERVDEYFVIN